jgi:hypothetical protein
MSVKQAYHANVVAASITMDQDRVIKSGLLLLSGDMYNNLKNEIIDFLELSKQCTNKFRCKTIDNYLLGHVKQSQMDEYELDRVENQPVVLFKLAVILKLFHDDTIEDIAFLLAVATFVMFPNMDYYENMADLKAILEKEKVSSMFINIIERFMNFTNDQTVLTKQIMSTICEISQRRTFEEINFEKQKVLAVTLLASLAKKTNIIPAIQIQIIRAIISDTSPISADCSNRLCTTDIPQSLPQIQQKKYATHRSYIQHASYS